MEITIKKETPKDYDGIDSLITAAFLEAEHADGNEAELVKKLRNSQSYLHELSFVAQLDGVMVGYIMFTALELKGAEGVKALTLAPLAVLPQFQGKGIGTRLVAYGITEAKSHGFDCVTVMGSEKYYPRFGFKPMADLGIKSSYDIPPANSMALELRAGCLANGDCQLVYPQEFGL